MSGRAPSSGTRSGGRRGEVLRALSEAEHPVGVAEIGRALGVHPNTVRFHLGHLQADGLVTEVRRSPRGPGRPASLFRVVPRMDPKGPRDYRVLAEILSQGIAGSEQAGEVATELGRAWGQEQAAKLSTRKLPRHSSAVRRLVRVLDDLGFAPDPAAPTDPAVPAESRTPGIATIGLRHCPYLELADKRPDVVCSAHLGMMRGLVQAWATPVTVEALVPFAEPDLCRVHLGATGAEP